jgi:class 3 adenylate cyclase
LSANIGLSAGEPIEESDEPLGAAVNLAARPRAHSQGGRFLVAETVKNLAMGKGIRFLAQGAIPHEGIPDPVRTFEVPWR